MDPESELNNIFRPFYLILGRMKRFRIERDNSHKPVQSSTREFRELDDMVTELTQRIGKDYRNLKEYTENMSHEVQTPIAIIYNKLETLVSDNQVMAEHSGIIKSIYDEVNHLSGLGKSLNLLTKIENGEFHEKSRISTISVIEKHLESVRELAELKKLKISAELTPDHRIEIDPILLDILLKNLFRNAIRYGTNDGPVIVQTTENSLEISNNGTAVKFPASEIFERFRTKNRESGSIGLGLAIVKKICDLNDLRISYNYNKSRHIFRITTS